jgi:hypothetical protein
MFKGENADVDHRPWWRFSFLMGDYCDGEERMGKERFEFCTASLVLLGFMGPKRECESPGTRNVCAQTYSLLYISCRPFATISIFHFCLPFPFSFFFPNRRFSHSSTPLSILRKRRWRDIEKMHRKMDVNF